MKDKLIKLLRENSEEYRLVSTNYLKGLQKNTSNRTALKYLSGWIARGGDTVKLSSKEYTMLELIKKGGPKPTNFSTKN